MAEWIPKTSLGRKVLSGEINSFDQVLESNQKILEPEIIDLLVPDLKDEVIDISSTQRMTAYGRKQQMRAVVIIGNRNGFIGVGVGKGAETRDAIAKAIKDAKMSLIRVPLGSGSWETRAEGLTNSIPMTVHGKNGSTQITIKPAPPGVGVVAGGTAKKVLELAGIRDCWTFAKGRTRNALNTIIATIKALKTLNQLKKGTEVKK